MFPNSDNFLTTRQCYILILAAVMVFPLLQRELKKIKAVSIILFVALGVFLIVMLLQLGLGNESQNPDKDYSIYY